MARMAKRNVERVSSSRKSAGERPKSIAALQLVRRCALGCIARIGALVQSAHWCRVRIGAGCALVQRIGALCALICRRLQLPPKQSCSRCVSLELR